MAKFKDILIIVAILILSIVISIDIFKPGLFVMHDDQQATRLFLFDEAIRGGQFPPRWVNSLGFGFGYPLFNFYPPFVYMFGELFHLLGFDFISSIKIVFFVSIIASGFGMYIFSKELFGRISGLVAAAAYLLVPYRAIDVYVRGALAESFAFVWLPLIFWAFLRLFNTGKTKYLLLSSVFLFLLMITHNLIFIPFMLILPIYLFFLFVQNNFKKTLIFKSVLAFVFAAGLSAFFWLPSLLEKKYTMVDELLITDLASYKIHFVFTKQLWDWVWGFGGSAKGLADGISFQIGKIHLLASLAAATIVIYQIIINLKEGRRYLFKHLLILVFAFLLIFSAFMSTNYSKLIWDKLTFLSYLQFPWRFLIFTSLFSALLMGALIYLLKVKILKIFFAATLLFALLSMNYKIFKPQYIRDNALNLTLEDYIKWDVSKSSFEYVPKGFPLKREAAGYNTADITKLDLPSKKAEILFGNAQIHSISSTPSKTLLKISSSSPSQLRLNTFYFPGWKAYVNGKEVQIDDQNKYKLITLTVPIGDSDILVKFENTHARLAANYISIISLLLLIPLSLKKWQILGKI